MGLSTVVFQPCPLGGLYTYTGCAGVYDLARRINCALKSRAFCRNLQRHTRKPYSKTLV